MLNVYLDLKLMPLVRWSPRCHCNLGNWCIRVSTPCCPTPFGRCSLRLSSQGRASYHILLIHWYVRLATKKHPVTRTRRPAVPPRGTMFIAPDPPEVHPYMRVFPAFRVHRCSLLDVF